MFMCLDPEINLIMCWYILLIFGIWIIVSFLTHRFLARSKKNMMIKDINKKSSNVMFVIAHPDDECMFFGPAITSMTQPVTSDYSVGRRKAKHVYLLCLSDGDANGLGKTRREELMKSCKILGLVDTNVIIHNGPPTFKDDQNSIWDAKLIADTLHFYIQKFKISNVVTFDEDGVSGHLNHISLFHGIVQLERERRKHVSVRYFVLESINPLRKYSAFVDSIFVRSNIICAADWSNRRTIQRAMAAHASQYVWFRRLYVIFSRYLFVNTFTPLDRIH